MIPRVRLAILQHDASMPSVPAKGSGRLADGRIEDPRAVLYVLEAALHRDLLDRQIRFGQEGLGRFDPHPVDLLVKRAAKDTAKTRLQGSTRHAHVFQNVGYLNGKTGVLADVLHSPNHIAVVGGQHIRRTTSDDACRNRFRDTLGRPLGKPRRRRITQTLRLEVGPTIDFAQRCTGRCRESGHGRRLATF